LEILLVSNPKIYYLTTPFPREMRKY